jgi:PEP-CTERM motif
MRWLVRSAALALGLAAFLGGSGRAGAAYVQYTETSSASGTFGGTAFTDAPITIIGFGDTTQIVSPSPGIFNLSLFANSVFVGGFATASFELDDIQMAVNQNTAEAGFLFGQSENLLLGLGVRGLSGYDLGFPAGPFVGVPLFQAGPSLATTAGALVFSSFSDEVTLTASAGPGPSVPEPSSLTLFGLGVVCLTAYARRTVSAGIA